MKKIFIFLLITSFFLCQFAFAEELPWKLVLSKNNISVYTRAVEGSSFEEFKGVTTLQAPLDVIVMVLQDIDSLTQWMSGCNEAFLVEQISDVENIVYFSQKLPWPVKDRDVISLSKANINLENKEFLETLTSVENNKIPVKKGTIRMASMSGHWKLNYIDRNSTLVEYQLKSDPAGSIPATIANMTCKKLPYETLLGLTDMVKKQKYIDRAEKSALRQLINKLISGGTLN